MQNGTPTITTPIGAEGIHEDYPWPGAICTNWESFLQAAIMLYQDQNQWHLNTES